MSENPDPATATSVAKKSHLSFIGSCIFYLVGCVFWLVLGGYFLVLLARWFHEPPVFLTSSTARLADSMKSITGAGNAPEESGREKVAVVTRVESRNDQGEVRGYDPGAILFVLEDREQTLLLGGGWAFGRFRYQGEAPSASVVRASKVLDLLTDVIEDLEQQYELTSLAPTTSFPMLSSEMSRPTKSWYREDSPQLPRKPSVIFFEALFDDLSHVLQGCRARPRNATFQREPRISCQGEALIMNWKIATRLVPCLATCLILSVGCNDVQAVSTLKSDAERAATGRVDAAGLPVPSHSFLPTTPLMVTRSATLQLADGKSDQLSIGENLIVKSDAKGVLRVSSYGRVGVVDRDSVVALDKAVDYFSERIGHDPHGGHWFSARGLAYRHLARRDLARADYDRGLELAPENADNWLRRGYLRRLNKDDVGAISDYDEAIKRQPEFWLAFLNRGIAKHHAAGSDRAATLQDFERAVRLAPHAARTHSGLAWYWLQLGEFEKCVAKSNDALGIDPAYPPALVNRAFAYAGLKNFEFATRDLASAATVDPSTVVQNYSRFVEWLSSPQLATSESGSTLFLKAYHQYRIGNIERCRHDLEMAETKSMDSGLVPLLRGLVGIQLGEFTEALPQLDLAFERGIVWSRLFYWRGQCHRELSNSTEAEEQYTRALELDPSMESAWIERAEVRRSLGKLEDAAQDAAMAVVVNPEAELSRLILGQVVLDRADFDTTYSAADAVIRLSPRNGEAHLLRAVALARKMGQNVDSTPPEVSKPKSEPLDQLKSKLQHVVTFIHSSSTYQQMISIRGDSLARVDSAFSRFSLLPPNFETASNQELRKWYQQRCRALATDVNVGHEVELAFLSLASLERMDAVVQKELDALVAGCLSQEERELFNQHHALQQIVHFPLRDSSRDVSSEKLNAAMRLIEKTLVAFPNNSGLLLLRGEAHLATGNFELAERDFTQVLLEAPDLLSPLRGRAWARIRLGNLEGAEADMNTIVTANPWAGQPLQNAQQLRSIQLIDRLAKEALDLTLKAQIILHGAGLEFPIITHIDKFTFRLLKEYDARVLGRVRSALRLRLQAMFHLQKAWDIQYDRHSTDIAGMQTLLKVQRVVLNPP
jgi:tetratricopeptide (TPR) repeat protein